MMCKIGKILKNGDTFWLESKVNNFINDNKIEIIDIKFEAENKMYYAMVMYRERQING